MQKIPAILLAAGFSSRMHAFKPLLSIAGQPLIRHVIQSLIDSAAIAPILVITGHNAALLQSALESFSPPDKSIPSTAPLHIRFNPDYAKGEMLSSLRTGLAALPSASPAFLLAFADQPAVQPATIRTLVDAFFSDPSHFPPLVLPTYLGKRGHPVVLSSLLTPAILALPPGDTLRTVVHQHLAQAKRVSVNDPSVLEDLDTPEDFLKAQTNWSRTVSAPFTGPPSP